MKSTLCTLLVGTLLAAGCNNSTPPAPETKSTGAVSAASSSSWNMIDKVTKTDEQWRAQLDAEPFRVLRKHGTERAFTGPLWDNHETGVYRCAGCGLELFHSETKFDSGTGWPSYFKPYADGHVGTTVDRAFFMKRTEVHCARCNGHLGHIFDDGPAPTGLRYCINSASLTFEKALQ